MSENTVKARLRHAVKPEATWTSDNPVLKEGEVGYVKETGQYKVGDGKTAWNSLAWAQPSSHTHDDRYIKLTGGTMTGALVIQGNAANKPLKVKGIVGSNGSSEDGELYLQYGVNQAVKLGSSGSYNISADGGTYSGKAAQATKLATARKIGNASFDGTKDITLTDIGVNNPIEITKAEYEELKKNNKLDMTAYYNIIDDYDSIGIINDETVAKNQVYSSSKSDSIYSKKSIVHNIILESKKWTKKDNDYQYVLSLDDITANNIVEINYSSTATSGEVTAYQKAEIKDGGQSKGQGILLTNALPAVDIPIVVVIRNDL